VLSGVSPYHFEAHGDATVTATARRGGEIVEDIEDRVDEPMVHKHLDIATDSGIGDGSDWGGSHNGVGRAEGRAEAGVATRLVDIPTVVVQEEEVHKDQEVDGTLFDV
jgi:hypothetical protein